MENWASAGVKIPLATRSARPRNSLLQYRLRDAVGLVCRTAHALTRVLTFVFNGYPPLFEGCSCEAGTPMMRWGASDGREPARVDQLIDGLNVELEKLGDVARRQITIASHRVGSP